MKTKLYSIFTSVVSTAYLLAQSFSINVKAYMYAMKKTYKMIW